MTHGRAHHLETILYAADRVRRYPNIFFLLAGEEAERERLMSLRDKLAPSNVAMLEQQPKEHMPWLWAPCHASLILLKKSVLFKDGDLLTVVRKLGDGETHHPWCVRGMGRIFQAAKAGFCIEPDNDEELGARVFELCSNLTLCQT